MLHENKESRPKFLEQCKSLVEELNIAGKLSECFTKRGFIGEPRIPLLVWLSTYTGKNRKLGKNDRPVSVLIKGPSGGGKSFGLNTGLSFVPDEEYLSLSGMSEKAIIYMEDVDLQHKHLVIGEAAGFQAGSGSPFLRQLISEGEINYSTVLKGKSGELGPNKLHIEGPTGVLMTTTATRLHHEDESRMLSINIDESQELRREALIAKAKGTCISTSAEELDFEVWHAFHRWVTSGPQDVSLPYAAEIVRHLPLHSDRIKRDFDQLLSLLKACALVHQNFRGRDKDGCIIANRLDYEIVYNLLDQALSENLAVAVPQGVRDVVDAVRELRPIDEVSDITGVYAPITNAQIAKHLNRDRSAVSRSVHKAIELEYLVDRNPGKGKLSQLDIGTATLPSDSVLPHPDELFAITGIANGEAAE